jgi:MHS family alpha-ketoglutarate permease-like MFS transporter
MTARITDIGRSSEKRVIKNVLRGSIGNSIEWYDWYAYTAFTTYFARSFLPRGDTTAIFAVGFLMRPIGGWLLGRFAGDHLHPRVRHDRHGGTGPVRARPAAAGPSVGGEYATSATDLSEVATSGRRGYYSSFQYVTLTAGQLRCWTSTASRQSR